MSHINWNEILGWSETGLEELRFSGFSFLRQGHYQKALLFFEALRILEPTNPYNVQTLGALHLQMGEGEKALEILDEALFLDPTHAPTLLNKTKALLMVHQKREALSLAKTLIGNEDLTIANDALALLTSYS